MKHIETECIHGKTKELHQDTFGAVTTPIYQTATFSHPGIGQTTGYNYTRESNPTRSVLEDTMTVLEKGVDSVACSTGMAAIGIVFELFENGDHILCSEDLYGGSVRMFDTMGKKRGLSFSYEDSANVEEFEKHIQENTKALYIETPSNPTMVITDLFAMKKLADKYHLMLIVDNTFLSPYYQNPIELGADIVIHSGTKYLCGHNDTLAGFITVNSEELAQKIRYTYKTLGASLAPFDCFLITRGIKTLAVRMERQQENAMKIAKWLQTQPKIKEVYYIGLPTHPGYDIQCKQARGFGGMISFKTDCEKTARDLLERIKLITYAESLGGVESLMTYPMLQTHGDLPKEVREKLGITEDFIRFSVGIENVDDLIEDIKQALGD